jgi:hypothetical protein
MKRLLCWLAWFAIALPGAAGAAEIVLAPSALDKLVAQAVFTNRGRFDLMPAGPCFAYLERPGVTLRDGRVRIRSHLAARIGVVDRGSCVGVALASWTEVSGRPVARGGSVVLADIRVDQVDDPNLRLLLESGLLPALPLAIELDVRRAVRGMLHDHRGQFDADVDAFAIDSVSVADDRLSVRFDFRLLAR